MKASDVPTPVVYYEDEEDTVYENADEGQMRVHENIGQVSDSSTIGLKPGNEP